MSFKKAERKAVKLKLAITGPSGAGKTYSALRLANGLGKKIAVIDTENGSASLYSDKFTFDVSELTPPFTVDKYVAAINFAAKEKYDVLIIDSVSAEWTEILEEKGRLDARPGSNHWTNWGPVTKKHNYFIASINNADIHIIATMRSKMDYMQTEENGKKKVQKVGMAPQQRDGVEYEYTTVFDVAMNNEAEVSKDRTGLFAGKIFKITEDTGREFLEWLKGAKAVEPALLKNEIGSDQEENKRPISTDEPNNTPINYTMKQDLVDLMAEKRWTVEAFNRSLQNKFGVTNMDHLKYWQFQEIMQLADQ